MEKQVGLKRVAIRGLEPFVPNCTLVAIIINKQRPCKFTNKNENKERAVWTFTVRDTPRDYVNVTFWGTPDIVFPMFEKFQLGDVVEIQNPNIEIRNGSDAGEKYCPPVTSPFKLTLNDNSPVILLKDGYFDNLLSLMHLPTKPIANYISLGDVHTNWEAMNDQSIDILVAIRSVSEIRQVNTRLGPAQVRNVVVFDCTNPGLQISIWETDYIIRASSWRPRLTVLFITDLKVLYDNFTKGVKGTLTRRSIITEDPICVQADNLREYAKCAAIQPSAILDQMVCSFPDPLSIKTIMNIQQVNTKIEQINEIFTNRTEDQQFTALVYGVITQMDIDGVSRVLSTRCIRCKQLITNSNKCENTTCTIGMGIENIDPETTFDVRITLTDQTGSLLNCRLSGKIAEKVLKCSVQEFLAMTDEEKCMTKWQYLTERCDVRLMIFCVKGKSPLISILNCSLANVNDFINKS